MNKFEGQAFIFFTEKAGLPGVEVSVILVKKVSILKLLCSLPAILDKLCFVIGLIWENPDSSI